MRLGLETYESMHSDSIQNYLDSSESLGPVEVAHFSWSRIVPLLLYLKTMQRLLLFETRCAPSVSAHRVPLGHQKIN